MCRQCGHPFCAEHGRGRCVECAAPERVLSAPWLLPGVFTVTLVLALAAAWFLSPWTLLKEKAAGKGLTAFPSGLPVLVEPAATEVVSPTPTAGPALRTYTVRQGDTLYDIALSFGVTVEQILSANSGLSPERLQIGQVLNIPSTTPIAR